MDERNNLKDNDEFIRSQQLERIKSQQQKRQKTIPDLPSDHHISDNSELSFTNYSGDKININDISALDLYRMAIREQQSLKVEKVDKKKHFDLVKKLYSAALEKFENFQNQESSSKVTSTTITYANCLRDFGEWIRAQEILDKSKQIYKRIIDDLKNECSIETALALIGYSKLFFLEIRVKHEEDGMLHNTSDEDEEKHLKKDEHERKLRESSDDSSQKNYVPKQEEIDFRESVANFRRALKILKDQNQINLCRENAVLIVHTMIDYYFLNTRLIKKSKII